MSEQSPSLLMMLFGLEALQRVLMALSDNFDDLPDDVKAALIEFDKDMHSGVSDGE